MSTLSRIAADWARRCFGHDHVNNLQVRSLRTVEEAIELCQSFGTPKEMVLKAVETVYSRPVGESQQEIGGVLLTTVILCEAMGLDHNELLERELTRVLQKSPEHFAKRNQEKINLGLDAGAQMSGVKWGGVLDQLTGIARQTVERMWRSPTTREAFERETGLSRVMSVPASYQCRFLTWCQPTIAAKKRAHTEELGYFVSDNPT